GLYAVANGGTRAVPVRHLVGPVGHVPADVSLSAGPLPVVCAVWESKASDELWCYGAGATSGRRVADDVSAVAVRPDGHAVAWTVQTPNQGFVVADLVGDVATVRSRHRYVEDAPPDAGIPESL